MDLKFGIIFLFQIVIGTMGNFSLLYNYMFLHFSGYRPRPTDLFLRHLIVANSLVILSRGMPETMEVFGKEHFLDDLGCKFVFYLHRVGRGVSIDTTCLLSVFQAITLSPGNSIWAHLKMKALKYKGPSIILCWVLHLLLTIRLPVLITDKRNKKNFSKTIDFQHCSVMLPENNTGTVFAAMTLSHDILCLNLMIWASGSMVLILYRHKQRVQHIHRQSSSRSSPETRASQNILALVSAFVFFYTLSSTLHACFTLVDKRALWLISSTPIISAGFPTISPFILMSHECSVSRLFRKK
ncbi:PREDICTED: vomeronasal type-1 receptor 2-like [Chinchilla lanigera]|uniref:vomeronasal type-1 receptor 2-like n=1 Tax=Chinchilla lanigera TaxID=34839 RepID=UPI00069710C8|nr:PREDICTED: vomeronasal type-1 receptor 2-like [Chinchilla lanigera]